MILFRFARLIRTAPTAFFALSFRITSSVAPTISKSNTEKTKVSICLWLV